MHKAVVVVASLLGAPIPALADWEFTRWGMTIREVERASRYTAILNGQGSGYLIEGKCCANLAL